MWLTLVEPVNQGLNRVHSGVLPVAVNDLAGQRLSHASLGSDALPLRWRDAAQVSAQQYKDGFVCHAPHCNPENGIPVKARTRYGMLLILGCAT